MIEASEEVLQWGFIVLISIGFEFGYHIFLSQYLNTEKKNKLIRNYSNISQGNLKMLESINTSQVFSSRI